MNRKVNMNRQIYMRSLGDRLSKLPQEDYEAAMEYFREYFDEAGPENEQQAIEDLGTPKEAAEQLIMNLAMRNSREPGKKNVKRSFSAVWVGILAVFAAPIAIPLAGAAVVGICSLALALVCFLGAIVIGAGGILAGGVVSVLLAAVLAFRSPADAMATIGAGLLMTGAGLFLLPGSISLIKATLRGTTRIFGRIVRRFAKGGRKNEKA